MASDGVHARVDPQTRSLIDKFAAANNMTFSQAVRVLLSLGLEKATTIDKTLSKAAFREGLIAGERKLLQEIGNLINSLKP